MTCSKNTPSGPLPRQTQEKEAAFPEVVFLVLNYGNAATLFAVLLAIERIIACAIL
jgi:hypothetical protein